MKKEESISDLLWDLDACEPAHTWVTIQERRGNKPGKIWKYCTKGEWLLWLACRLGFNYEVAMIAVEVARLCVKRHRECCRSRDDLRTNGVFARVLFLTEALVYTPQSTLGKFTQSDLESLVVKYTHGVGVDDPTGTTADCLLGMIGNVFSALECASYRQLYAGHAIEVSQELRSSLTWALFSRRNRSSSTLKAQRDLAVLVRKVLPFQEVLAAMKGECR